MELKRGDIIMSYEKSITSWIVAKFTKSKYSHVGVYLGNNEYISAVPFKSVCITKTDTIKYFDVYRMKEITKEQIDKVIEFCESKINAKYDFMQCILLFYRKVSGKLKKNNSDPNENKYECSELIGEAFASQGIKFCEHIENTFPGTIADSDLTEFICSKGKIKG